MTDPVIVFKYRTNTVRVSLPYDVSGDTITAEIRKEAVFTSELLATWEVTHVTDGTDGQLVLRLDDSVASEAPITTALMGYMDLKRITAGEPVPVLNNAIPVEFRNPVTA